MGPVRALTDWRGFADSGQRTGRTDAPVTVVVFMDYQCPSCRAFHDVLEEIAKDSQIVSVVYRHYPLTSIHPHARAAAVVAECSAVQGRFWQISAEFFRQQDSIGQKTWDRFAAGAGVRDRARFTRCVADSVPLKRIDLDIAAAQKLGAPGTPTFLLNGAIYTGSRSTETMKRLIDRARE